MDWQVIAPQLVALTLGILGIVQGLRKQRADNATVYLEALREDMDKLRDRMDGLEDYAGMLEAYISALTIQMTAAGLIVPARPMRRTTKTKDGQGK